MGAVVRSHRRMLERISTAVHQPGGAPARPRCCRAGAARSRGPRAWARPRTSRWARASRVRGLIRHGRHDRPCPSPANTSSGGPGASGQRSGHRSSLSLGDGLNDDLVPHALVLVSVPSYFRPRSSRASSSGRPSPPFIDARPRRIPPSASALSGVVQDGSDRGNRPEPLPAKHDTDRPEQRDAEDGRPASRFAIVGNHACSRHRPRRCEHCRFASPEIPGSDRRGDVTRVHAPSPGGASQRLRGHA